MLRLWPYSSIFSDTPHSSHSVCSKHESCVQSAGCGMLGQCSQEATSTGEHAGVLCCRSQGLWDVQQIGLDSHCLKGSRILFVIYLLLSSVVESLFCLQLVTLSLAGRQVCAGTSCCKLVLYNLRAELFTWCSSIAKLINQIGAGCWTSVLSWHIANCHKIEYQKISHWIPNFDT